MSEKRRQPSVTSGPTIRRVRLSELRPDPMNANKGTERGLRMLDDSLTQYGPADAGTLDQNLTVISGNKRLELYADKGVEEVDVVTPDPRVPVWIQRDDLRVDSPAGRALALLLNRSAEFHLYDPEILIALEAAGQIPPHCWTEPEWAKLLNEQVVDLEPDPEPHIVTCPACGKTFAP